MGRRLEEFIWRWTVWLVDWESQVTNGSRKTQKLKQVKGDSSGKVEKIFVYFC